MMSRKETPPVYIKLRYCESIKDKQEDIVVYWGIYYYINKLHNAVRSFSRELYWDGRMVSTANTTIDSDCSGNCENITDSSGY